MADKQYLLTVENTLQKTPKSVFVAVLCRRQNDASITLQPFHSTWLGMTEMAAPTCACQMAAWALTNCAVTREQYRPINSTLNRTAALEKPIKTNPQLIMTSRNNNNKAPGRKRWRTIKHQQSLLPRVLGVVPKTLKPIQMQQCLKYGTRLAVTSSTCLPPVYGTLRALLILPVGQHVK